MAAPTALLPPLAGRNYPAAFDFIIMHPSKPSYSNRLGPAWFRPFRNGQISSANPAGICHQAKGDGNGLAVGVPLKPCVPLSTRALGVSRQSHLDLRALFVDNLSSGIPVPQAGGRQRIDSSV